jgi:hypothetical protein
MHVKSACATSITLVGWASVLSLAFHLACSAPPVPGQSSAAYPLEYALEAGLPHKHCAPRTALNTGADFSPYIPGILPFDYWLMVLPGVLFGSMVGPWINGKIGNRNVMIIFCFFLVADAVYNLVEVFGHHHASLGPTAAPTVLG